VFDEHAQRCLRFCLDHLNCAKMIAFKLYLPSGRQRKVWWVADDSHVMLGERFLVERKRETVRCRDATASSFVVKFLGKVLAHFEAVAVKCHSNMRKWLFDLPGRILCERYPRCQRKLWACSWLCSSIVSVSLDFPCTAHASFSERLSNHCHGLRLTFPEICTTFDAVPVLDSSRNYIRPDTDS
jgi:hypothetical protein